MAGTKSAALTSLVTQNARGKEFLHLCSENCIRWIFGLFYENVHGLKTQHWYLQEPRTRCTLYIYQEIPALKPMGYQPVSCKLWSKQSSIINKHFSVTIYISRFLSWFYLALFWNNFGALFFALVLIVLTPLNFIFWLWSYVLCSCQLFWHTN